MKKLFYFLLPAVVFFISSCTDEVKTNEANSEYLFQKEMTIKDDDGNSADITFFTNSQEELDQHSAEDFILFTTTEKFESSETTTPENTNAKDSEITDPNDLLILITNFNLNADVTGFSVRSKFDAYLPRESTTRSSSTYKYYQLGSNGVKGAKVTYNLKTCSDEYMKIKLSKKTWPFSVLWSTLANGTLYYEGAKWSYSTSTYHYQYRLRIKLKDQCNGTASFTHSWIID